MEKFELMKDRHSVRRYLDIPIEQEKIDQLMEVVKEANETANLNIQLQIDEPEAFGANLLNGFGVFKSCRNYFVMVGPEGADEAIGYYGQKLVLLAQEIGLNTCWVASNFRKDKIVAELREGDKLHLAIALGYGENQGTLHAIKPVAVVSNVTADSPQWFKNGIKAALLAPTAMNQQKFFFTLEGNTVKAEAKVGFYSKVDLGIAKYHFELGAGVENFEWA